MKRALLISASFAAIAVIEELRPLRRRVEKKSRHAGRDVALAALSGLATALMHEILVAPAAARAERRKEGLLRRINLPGPLRTAAGIMLLDYTLWVWHWLNHRNSMLWRFHRVHHVDLDLDSWTALRFHFGEMTLAAVLRMLQIRIIGPDRAALAIWQGMLLPSIFFHHSMIRLPWNVERALSRLIVTPRMHAIHHSTRRDETDSNWSSMFSIWDFLHGTFRLDVPQETITIGVPAYQRAEDVTLGRSLMLPLSPVGKDWIVRSFSPAQAGEKVAFSKRAGC